MPLFVALQRPVCLPRAGVTLTCARSERSYRAGHRRCQWHRRGLCPRPRRSRSGGYRRDIDDVGAKSMAQEVGGKAWDVDLSDVVSLETLRLETDILVNNAGIQSIASIPDFPPDRFRMMLTLMVEAPFLLIRAVLPYMYEQGFGRIINISSVHGLRASEYKVAYVTAKHALEGLSKVTALEGGPHGVTSNCVNPGYARTPLVTKQIVDQARTHGIPEQEGRGGGTAEGERDQAAGRAGKRLPHWWVGSLRRTPGW